MMSLLRICRQQAIIRTPVRAVAVQQRAYAEDASKKAAQPKILNEAPPDEKELSTEAKAHNEDVDKRNAKMQNEDGQKDKVERGYWAGSKSSNPQLYA